MHGAPSPPAAPFVIKAEVLVRPSPRRLAVLRRREPPSLQGVPALASRSPPPPHTPVFAPRPPSGPWERVGCPGGRGDPEHRDESPSGWRDRRTTCVGSIWSSPDRVPRPGPGGAQHRQQPRGSSCGKGRLQPQLSVSPPSQRGGAGAGLQSAPVPPCPSVPLSVLHTHSLKT